MQMLCSLRRWLRGLEPRVRGQLERPWLLRLQPWLEQRALFRFQRQPLARGVAAGMFCGLIPGPLQLPGTLLAYGLALVLVFIGTKMLLIDFYKIPIGYALLVTATLIAGSVLLSLRGSSQGVSPKG